LLFGLVDAFQLSEKAHALSTLIFENVISNADATKKSHENRTKPKPQVVAA